MKSIKARFNECRKDNPATSDYICFAVAIMDQNFNKRTIKENFNRLVDKKDYSARDKKKILQHLYKLNSSK